MNKPYGKPKLDTKSSDNKSDYKKSFSKPVYIPPPEEDANPAIEKAMNKLLEREKNVKIYTVPFVEKALHIHPIVNTISNKILHDIECITFSNKITTTFWLCIKPVDSISLITQDIQKQIRLTVNKNTMHKMKWLENMDIEISIKTF